MDDDDDNNNNNSVDESADWTARHKYTKTTQ